MTTRQTRKTRQCSIHPILKFSYLQTVAEFSLHSLGCFALKQKTDLVIKALQHQLVRPRLKYLRLL